MGKSTLFESPRVLVGLNAFRPGQEHALHAHGGMDKVYVVVRGRGTWLLEGRELPLHEGELLVAPEGAPHGIRNTGSEDLVVLALLAPGPAGAGQASGAASAGGAAQPSGGAPTRGGGGGAR
jgi:mannose-6-phosphate isomerase-like protein (cupin superfamily)